MGHNTNREPFGKDRYLSSIKVSAVVGGSWLHEVKFDGYQVQVRKVGSCVFSRKEHNFTERFP